MRLLWQHHDQEEDWGVLLIDLGNVFNENKCTVMLWDMHQEWPSGAQFAFN